MNTTFYSFEARCINYLILNTGFTDVQGICKGKAASVLYAYTTKNAEVDKWIQNTAFSFLEETLSQVNIQSPLFFGNGIAGLGVLLEHLSQKGFLDEDTNEILEESEPFLLNFIYRGGLKDVGINSGISGFGLYFLHRISGTTSPSAFQQMRLKECIIACVDQISFTIERQLENEEENWVSDITVFNGLSGTCLFLNWVNKLKWYEPCVAELLQKTANLIFKIITNTPFAWQKTEAYFTLLHCDLTKSNKLFKEKVLRSFNSFIEKAGSQKQSIAFHNAAFVALWLRLIGEEHTNGKSKLLSKDIKKIVTTVLKNNYLSDLFPYNEKARCVPVGLDGGVCGTALPMLSLESEDYNWLSIFGIQLSFKSNSQ